MTVELRVGDIGTLITVTVTDAETGNAVDISGATELALLLRKPGGTLVQKTPTFTTDGTDGQISYEIVEDDLSVAGQWKAQVFVQLDTGEWYSTIEPFYVLANLGIAETS